MAAIRELYRVLMPGGIALINDLRGDASQADIDAMVEGMKINAVNKFMTRGAFRFMLVKNAYTPVRIQQMAAQTEFRQAHRTGHGVDEYMAEEEARGVNGA